MTTDDAAPDVVLDLPHGVDAPALARAYLTRHASNLPPAVLDDARLLVSELVGNAVRHGRAAITLRLRSDPPGIGVEVSDQGTELPTLPDGRPDASSPSGRGLLIVASLADRWGVDSHPDGKTVWFELGAD